MRNNFKLPSKMSGLLNDFIEFTADQITNHPKGTAIGGTILIITNIGQCISRGKEKKRHAEAEYLQQEVIRKHDALIKDLAKQAEKANYLISLNDTIEYH